MNDAHTLTAQQLAKRLNISVATVTATAGRLGIEHRPNYPWELSEADAARITQSVLENRGYAHGRNQEPVHNPRAALDMGTYTRCPVCGAPMLRRDLYLRHSRVCGRGKAA